MVHHHHKNMFSVLLPEPKPYVEMEQSVADTTPSIINELFQFLSWKDPKIAQYATELFEMYSVHHVAKAIRARYGMTPPGWRSTHLVCHTIDYMAIMLPPPKTKLSKLDMVINELVETEQYFVEALQTLERDFLDQMFKIYGSGTAKEIKSLGLTQQETNQVFEKLVHIRMFSEELLQRLFCVDLIQNVEPAVKDGRAQCVAKAFIEMAPKLHVFAPATMCYKDSLDVLAGAEKRLSKRSSKTVTFVSLWNKATSKDGSILLRKRFADVLVTPMQRIPRYKMLLEALVKGCTDPQVCMLVQKALDMVSSAATQINDVVGKHEKLGKMFGESTASGLAISSTGGVNENGGIIVNAYKNKIAAMM